MRVITGRFKGRTLKTVKDLSVRPATDRVKQTIFDMLVTRVDLDGATVLDLFAGSGGLGIEALSRGAERVVFVENGSGAVDFIEQNVRMLGCEDQTEIHETDALMYVARARGSYDVVFADPPYTFTRLPELPAIIFSAGLVKRDGYCVVEHPTSLHFDSTGQYLAGPEKKFGRTLVTFFQHPSQTQEATP
ncbi:MAG: 16S rRNA (guanine(966)-N(2))-methyltransferase RsmD [Bacteroidota bacterium]